MAFFQKYIGDNIKLISEQAQCNIIEVSDETGEGKMTAYEVFDGVYVMYNEFHMQHCISKFRPDEAMFCIDHCLEGRIEWAVQEGGYLYMQAGDIQLNANNFKYEQFSFPLSHYHGLTIAFSVKKFPQIFSKVWEDFEIDLQQIMRKFCPSGKPYVMRADGHIDHIFSELYHVPEHVRMNYFKVKILELLIFLEITAPSDDGTQRYFEKKQVDKIKAIEQLLTTHLEQKITLESLSRQFDLPLSTMQQCFKGVFGTSIYAYMKNYRMNAAAVMLKKTDQRIIDIAGLVGYENAGKFSAAFTSVMGMTPSTYRKLANKME